MRTLTTAVDNEYSPSNAWQHDSISDLLDAENNADDLSTLRDFDLQSEIE